MGDAAFDLIASRKPLVTRMTIRIQRAWRRRLARLNSAAKTVQCFWRAHSGRNKGAIQALSFVSRLLQSKNTNKISGLNNVVNNVQILIEQSMRNKKENAANRIQSAWREYKMHK